jgi:hypothetical protein
MTVSNLIPRVAEAIDAELIRQKMGSQWVIDLDPESLAIAAIADIAERMEREGFAHPARWLRSQIPEGR